ncbi:MBL fold metallo-hydrolase [Pseudobutyrivibrio xylanivorans]|uniref:Glyoxylase, beta-lactamase superfamily II n=1 Tax=Pseudobutyrivibrio xylanivorans TaxID=185007 RepID=A0A1G5RRV8_PSEXY|nr:MBL fold metallo-hydrolase [Pseudobutyrivibrio xylanivorans]SCZ76802.1 Glyoxylase, beta-lactamase superfamily II [Pseudobutyrivibrio xylanivorans]
MKVMHILLPVCAMNCYLAINEETKESIIIDPGSSPKRIKAGIEQSGTTPVAIILTHGHFDHVGAADEIAAEYGIKIYAYEGERETLENPHINLSADMIFQSTAYHADVYLKDEQEVQLAGLTFKCLATPGHTPGGCCFYFANEGIVFTGDTLFCGSVGRTDFPGGSMSQLVNSINEKLMVLPGDTICYPGHESATTIEFERNNNMFL